MITSVIGIDEVVILFSASQNACINSSLAPITARIKYLAEVLLKCGFQIVRMFLSQILNVLLSIFNLSEKLAP